MFNVFFHKTIFFLQPILILADLCFQTSIPKVSRVLKKVCVLKYWVQFQRRPKHMGTGFASFSHRSSSILFCPLLRSEILIFNAIFHSCFPFGLVNGMYH